MMAGVRPGKCVDAIHPFTPFVPTNWGGGGACVCVWVASRQPVSETPAFTITIKSSKAVL